MHFVCSRWYISKKDFASISGKSKCTLYDIRGYGIVIAKVGLVCIICEYYLLLILSVIAYKLLIYIFLTGGSGKYRANFICHLWGVLFWHSVC